MAKQLWELMYGDPVYAAATRIVGYFGCDPFHFWDEAKKFDCYHEGKFRSAMLALTRSDARERVDPRYELNAEALRWCYQLLGPKPEDWDRHYRNADGTPGPRHAAKMAELAERTGKPVQPQGEPKKSRPAPAEAGAGPAIRDQPQPKRKTPTRKGKAEA